MKINRRQLMKLAGATAAASVLPAVAPAASPLAWATLPVAPLSPGLTLIDRCVIMDDYGRVLFPRPMWTPCEDDA